MGMDTSVDMALGCLVTGKSFEKLVKKFKDVTHQEDRFDVQTGKKQAKKVTVIDEHGGSFWILGDEKFMVDDEFDMMCRELAKRIGCSVTITGDQYSGMNYIAAIFGPISTPVKKLAKPRGIEGFSAPLVITARVKKEADRICKALRDLKVKVDQPGIYSVLNVT